MLLLNIYNQSYTVGWPLFNAHYKDLDLENRVTYKILMWVMIP